jgi:hypothetical protein
MYPPTSTFWSEFVDTKVLRIQRRKFWAYNRKPPKTAVNMITILQPVKYVFLSFGLKLPGVKSEAGQYWGKILGPTPTPQKVKRALQDLQVEDFKKDRPEIRFK